MNGINFVSVSFLVKNRYTVFHYDSISWKTAAGEFKKLDLRNTMKVQFEIDGHVKKNINQKNYSILDLNSSRDFK